MTAPSSGMIFAAGFGTRMGEATRSMPKPMLSLGGRPMIDHSIGLMSDAGISQIVANTHYLHDQISPYLEQRGITVVHESPDILETGGGLRNALPALGSGPVVTANSDAVWLGRNPFSLLLEHWRDDMEALLLLVPLSRAHGTGPIGDFGLEQGIISRNGPYRYTGAQIIRTGLLSGIPDQVFSLNAYWDFIGKTRDLHGLIYDGDWCEAGDIQGLATAERLLKDV